MTYPSPDTMASDDIEPVRAEELAPDHSETDSQECVACATRFPLASLVQLGCEDEYCRACLEKIFKTAMKDETMYPPRCCGLRIGITIARKYLSKSLLRTFVALQPELSTRDKTYCHRPTCSAFIAPHSIHNGHAICQKCLSVTCSKCRKEWHWGRCVDGEDDEFFDFLRSTNWKRCPGCRRVVEKNTGCNHMTCRCGGEFCYSCGEELDMCSCHSDDDVDEDDALY